MRPWLAAAGHSEFALRFPAALAGALAVPVIYVLVRRLAGVRPALLAALLTATAPYLVWYGQEAKMYALLTVLVPLTLWLALRAVERGGWRWWVLLYVATSFSFYTHVLAALVVLVQGMWFGVLLLGGNLDHEAAKEHEEREARRTRRFARLPSRFVPFMGLRAFVIQTPRWLPPALYLAALVLPYLPMVWWQVRLWLSPTFETGHPFVPLPDILTVLAVAFSRGILPVEQPATLLPAMLALLAGIGLWPSGRGRRRTVVLLLIWLFVPPLALFGVSLGMPLFADRYLIWAMPAYLALWALGISALTHAWRPLGLLTAAVLLAFNLAGVWSQTHQPLKADFRSAAAFVVEHQRPDDLLIFQIPYNSFSFRYYSDQLTSTSGRLRGMDGPYTNDGLSAEAVAEIMAKGTAQAPAAWLIASEAPMWDRRDLTQAWLNAHGVVTDHAEFTRVTVTRYQLY
jgi:hypothetical protein